MARLQVSYDCWLEQIEEGHQDNHIMKCKDVFYEALGNMQGIKSTVIVYFDNNSFDITPDEMQKLEAVVSNYQVRRSDITVEGHTDTLDTDEYNKELSLQRAKAVAGAIKRLDGNIENIEVEGFGEEKLAIETADRVSEPRNRRAIVHFE